MDGTLQILQFLIIVWACSSLMSYSFLSGMHNLGSETKRAAGSPLWGAIRQTGSILGSHLYPLASGPAYLYVTPYTLFTIAIAGNHRHGFGCTSNFARPNDVDVDA